MTTGRNQLSPAQRLGMRIWVWLVVMFAALALMLFITTATRRVFTMMDSWVSYNPNTLEYVPRFTYDTGKLQPTPMRWSDSDTQLNVRSRSVFTTLKILDQTVAFDATSIVEEFKSPPDAPTHQAASVYQADTTPTMLYFEGIHGIPQSAWNLSERSTAGVMTAKRNRPLLFAWIFLPPILVGTIVAASLVVALSWHKLRKLRRVGKCPGCGYSRTGLADRACPECNTPAPVAARA